MSLRQSPTLTPALLAARRRNVEKSTGPRTLAGKQRVKFNALKHGRYASPHAFHESLRALGEDPEEFDRLCQGLLLAAELTDPLWVTQVEDLAKLYWRRARLERGRDALLRRQLESLEAQQVLRQEQVKLNTIDASEDRILDINPSLAQDPVVRLRQILSYLEVIRQQVTRRAFQHRQATLVQYLYGDGMSWRVRLVHSLLSRFARAQSSDFPPDLDDNDHQRLIALLDEEIASVKEAFEPSLRASEQSPSTARDLRLLPSGEQWAALLRQEEALDRAIDRKVKILLSLRRAPAVQPEAREESEEVSPDGAPDEQTPAGTTTSYEK